MIKIKYIICSHILYYTVANSNSILCPILKCSEHWSTSRETALRDTAGNKGSD